MQVGKKSETKLEAKVGLVSRRWVCRPERLLQTVYHSNIIEIDGLLYDGN